MIRLSLVEDLPDVVNSLKRAFSTRKDMNLVSSYSNAESAIEKIRSSEIDLVLLDLGLPKMNGLELMIRLKNREPGLSFIVFTVFDNDEKLFDALRYGADGYILKSEGTRGVIRAVQEWKDGGAPMSRSIAQKVLSSFRPASTKNPLLEKLTPKQLEVLRYVSEGLYNKEIADRMGVKENTVKQHLHTTYRKLHVNNRVEAKNIYDKKG